MPIYFFADDLGGSIGMKRLICRGFCMAVPTSVIADFILAAKEHTAQFPLDSVELLKN